MPTLHILRHAKSSWDDPELADSERPLAPRGRKDAGKAAAHLRKRGIAPSLVLCSSSLRTRQTLELVAEAWGTTESPGETLIETELYAASAGQLLARLHALPDSVGEVLLIGHNPGCQELALHLARDGELRDQVARKFPTCALATLEAPATKWRSLAAGDAELAALFLPRKGSA